MSRCTLLFAQTPFPHGMNAGLARAMDFLLTPAGGTWRGEGVLAARQVNVCGCCSRTRSAKEMDAWHNT